MKHFTKTIAIKAGTGAAATLVIGLAMLWLTGAFGGNRIIPGKVEPLRAAPPTGKAVPVAQVIRPHLAEVVGTVQAEVRTTISGRLVANIVSVTKRAGDPVVKGEPLVVLDDRDVRARVAQAEQAVRAAEVVRDFARIEVNRFAKMFADNAATEYELQSWQSKLHSAEADVLRTTQALAESKVALSDAQIVAPFDGIVVDRLAEPGDQASPGKPLLTVYDPARLRLEASVREAYIAYLTLKKDAKEQVPVFVVAVGQERRGVIQEIVPAADPASRSFLVKVPLADGRGLYPGMFGRMRVPIGEERRLLVPAAAVQSVGQLNLVRVIDAGSAQRRSVRLGERAGDQVEVLAGIAPGDRVLIP